MKSMNNKTKGLITKCAETLVGLWFAISGCLYIFLNKTEMLPGLMITMLTLLLFVLRDIKQEMSRIEKKIEIYFVSPTNPKFLEIVTKDEGCRISSSAIETIRESQSEEV